MELNPCAMHLKDGTLHPPDLSPDADDGSEIPWVLLEDRGYVADRRNATTACTDTKSGYNIQVTFCVDRPPVVSYISVFCPCPFPDDQKEMIAMDPRVLATDHHLVLLRIAVRTDRARLYDLDLYIYQPAGDGGPSLTRIERTPGNYIISPTEVGLLRCGQDGSSSNLYFLRPHRAPEVKPYLIAALCDDPSEPERGRFLLYLYNSKIKSWATILVSVEYQQFQQYQEEGYFRMHLNSKTISIGGEAGTMGFVDLWRGILLCDLLRVQDTRTIRYLQLPQPLQPEDPARMDDARSARDIAFVQGYIKCVDIDGWIVSIWSIPVTTSSSLDDTTWKLDYKIDFNYMDVDPQLLPAVHYFQTMRISQPTLSLQDDDTTVCFMVKINNVDEEAWVISVDMMNNKLEDVVEFDARRYAAVDFAYLHSRISKYLNNAQATKGNLKRPGLLLMGSLKKKHPGSLREQDTEMDDD